MYVPFDQLPDDSRIWIFQSDRLLSEEEIESINPILNFFISDWTAHQQTLRASFTFLHNHFLIIGVDENMAIASGCSLDKVFHVVRACGQKINTDFLNRLHIAAMIQNVITLHSVKQILDIAENRNNNEPLMIFSNIIETKSEMKNNWLIPIEKSWLAPKLKSGSKI